ncbi:expressed protein [Phakopsora pachyrhizi]|uniref:Expressed protein n=1 Tax=Phakopsora pachyrhizi TaxID=170000 RepID=A0AAV0ANF0_PHAPC|nr:expressed protein [Phakopsora pachyrhizi]
MFNHLLIAVLLLLTSSFFTLFCPESYGIIFYASASHIPPDIVNIFEESSHPESSSGKVIDNLGNYADSKDEVVPSENTKKRPRDESSISVDSNSKSSSSGKVVENLGNYANSKDEAATKSRRLDEHSSSDLVREFKYENPSGGLADNHSSRSSSLSNSDYYEIFSAKLYNLKDYPDSSRWKTISESFIEYFINKIHSFSGKNEPDAKDMGGDDIIQMFEALNNQKIYVKHLKTLCNSILSDEETLKIFAIKIINIVINKWGYISVFQTSDIQRFLLFHPDLVKFRNLMFSCDKNQWKKIEQRFLEAHLEERLKDDLLYKDSVLNMMRIHIKEEFSKLKNPVEEGFKIPYELNLDYNESEPFVSFTNSVFVFHTVNYLRSYFEGVSLDPFLADCVTAFDGIFDVFQRALKVQIEIINPEHVKDFQLKNENAKTLDIECLRLLKHHSTPAQVPDSKLILYDVSLDIKSSSIDAINAWLFKIRSAIRMFRSRYDIINDFWPDDGHTYVAHDPNFFKDHYFRNYIQHIKEQQQHIEKNYQILETRKEMFYRKPQQN